MRVMRLGSKMKISERSREKLGLRMLSWRSYGLGFIEHGDDMDEIYKKQRRMFMGAYEKKVSRVGNGEVCLYSSAWIV